MIAELIAGGVLLAAAISGWVAAYRARGESVDGRDDVNAAADRARAAEVATGVERRAKELAESQRSALAAELRAAKAEVEVRGNTIARLERERVALYDRLAQLGAPVGDVLLDDVVGGLYQDRNEGG